MVPKNTRILLFYCKTLAFVEKVMWNIHLDFWLYTYLFISTPTIQYKQLHLNKINMFYHIKNVIDFNLEKKSLFRNSSFRFFFI